MIPRLTIKGGLSKFKSRRSEYDSIKFSSQKEANRYKELKLLQSSGEVLFFLRQVPFYFPGGGKYVLDFMVFWGKDNDIEITFEEVKGFKTESYKLKKKLVESMYPINLTEI